MLTTKMFGLASRFAVNQLIHSFRSVSITPAAALPKTLFSHVAESNTTTTTTTTTDAVTDTVATRRRIFENVNTLVQHQQEGRLFAVVHLCGKQFKVTAGDIILVEGYWPPATSDKIRLDKVLVAGGEDFTLIGRPLVQKGLVDVQATIIEKTLTHTKTHFRKKRRKQYMRINFYRSPNTMLMINSIQLTGAVNGGGAAGGNEDLRIF